MFARIIIANLLLVTALPLAAETRLWRSADGERSIDARFVKRDADSVTVLRGDRIEVTIPLDMIHRDDREWLDARHPLIPDEPPPAALHMIEILEFGDSRAQVTEKLKASELVEATLPETMLARTGLSGVFRVHRKVGGLTVFLYFDWSEDGGLKDIILRTAPVTGDDIEARLTPCWKEYIELLTARHGQPLQANDKLGLESIADHSMSATHLWRMENLGSVTLGAAREGDGYLIAVRFTTEEIEPIVIPAPAPAAPATSSAAQ